MSRSNVGGITGFNTGFPAAEISVSGLGACTLRNLDFDIIGARPFAGESVRSLSGVTAMAYHGLSSNMLRTNEERK